MKHQKMSWEKLLSRQRIYDREDIGMEKKITHEDASRSQFEKDCDRIIFSHPFRRLQNKTQVVPFPGLDFIHTRLTHTIEVSSMGYWIGRIIGEHVLENNRELKKDKYTAYDFGFIVKAACLIHDLGNPAFGHSGENAISDYFQSNAGKSIYQDFFLKNAKHTPYFDEKHWHDLTHFEGNAATFRLINKQNLRGFNLTYATLGAFLKYPWESYFLNENNIDQRIIPLHKCKAGKFGFFQSETKIMEKVALKTGLIPGSSNINLDRGWCRHPLAYLMEAADDICNSLMDYEDLCRLKKISTKEAEKVFSKIADNEINPLVLKKLKPDHEKTGYLRGKAMKRLVKLVSQAFIDVEDKILSGEYVGGLLNRISDQQVQEGLNDMEKVVKEKGHKEVRVLELETAGFEVLCRLVWYFCAAVNQKQQQLLSPAHASKLEQLIPDEYKLKDDSGERGQKDEEKIYKRIMLILDYVGGMSDDFAVKLYRRISGFSIPDHN